MPSKKLGELLPPPPPGGLLLGFIELLVAIKAGWFLCIFPTLPLLFMALVGEFPGMGDAVGERDWGELLLLLLLLLLFADEIEPDKTRERREPFRF
jgi:hypothetical protein